MMNHEQMNELLQNEAFVTEMKNAETIQDAIGVLGGWGIDATEEELKDLQARALEFTRDGELTEDGLEQVAGGRNMYAAWTFVGLEYAGLAAIVGGVATGPVGWAVLGGMAVSGLLACCCAA